MTGQDHRYYTTRPTFSAWEARLVCACGWSTEEKSIYRARVEYNTHLFDAVILALNFQIGPTPEEAARGIGEEQEYEPQR